MARKTWDNGGNASSKYITNDMLSPFTSSAGPGGMPTSQIEMSLSCRNLLNADILSKSDPYCIIYMKEPWQDRYFEFGRTEKIDDTLNPEWVKNFVINYNFETVQKMKFEVWDVDPDGQDFLGHFETSLADIVSHSGRQFTGNLTGIPGKNCGQILVVTEEVATCKQQVKMHFQAIDLARMHWFTKNDPFLVFSRANEDGTFSVVAKTEVQNWTQHPRWRPIIMRVTTLCNGDYDRNIRMDCYDYRNSGSHKLIGTCYSTLRNLSVGGSKTFNLAYPNKANKSAGKLELLSIEVMEDITFLDYIRNGTQLHFAVAIDFTASNGTPTDPNSLHFLSPHRPNNYEIALRSVGEIIQSYDSAQLYPAFGKYRKCVPIGVTIN